MKLSKNCRYLVRVRDYETVHIEVGAEISHHDIGYDDDHWTELSEKIRDEETETLHEMLNTEVDRIAREELAVIAGWSEISPNLAEDYLSVEAPTNLQRKPHAKTTSSQPTPSGAIRRRAAASSA